MMQSIKTLLKVLFVVPSLLFVIGCGCGQEVVAEPEPVVMPEPQAPRG